MTPHRRQQLESIYRRMRTNPALWGNLGQAKEDQADRILSAVRNRLRPIWKEEQRQRFDALFKCRYEIDTAINYS